MLDLDCLPQNNIGLKFVLTQVLKLAKCAFSVCSATVHIIHLTPDRPKNTQNHISEGTYQFDH